MTIPTPQGSCAVFFSGGKDSTLALHRARQRGYQPQTLVTLYDGPSGRTRFHGVTTAVMRAQAAALDLPILLAPTTSADFAAVCAATLAELAASGMRQVIFGDIHLADVRAWYEERVTAAGMTQVEPLWGEAPAALAREVVALGFRAIITGIEERMADAAWLGRPLDEAIIAECERRGIDPAGERGEYHTLVVAGPGFRTPLATRTGAIQRANGFQQIDLILE